MHLAFMYAGATQPEAAEEHNASERKGKRNAYTQTQKVAKKAKTSEVSLDAPTLEYAAPAIIPAPVVRKGKRPASGRSSLPGSARTVQPESTIRLGSRGEGTHAFLKHIMPCRQYPHLLIYSWHLHWCTCGLFISSS